MAQELEGTRGYLMENLGYVLALDYAGQTGNQNQINSLVNFNFGFQ